MPINYVNVPDENLRMHLIATHSVPPWSLSEDVAVLHTTHGKQHRSYNWDHSHTHFNLFVRATYSDDWFESDEPDTDPSEEGGYVDPENPWGGFEIPCPDGLVGEPFVQWREEHAPTKRFASFSRLVEFVEDFPGGVWDIDDESVPTLLPNGRWRRVWLHIDGGEQEVTDALYVLRKD